MGSLVAFLTIPSPAYVKQVHRILGRPFVKAHHVVPAGTFTQERPQCRGN